MEDPTALGRGDNTAEVSVPENVGVDGTHIRVCGSEENWSRQGPASQTGGHNEGKGERIPPDTTPYPWPFHWTGEGVDVRNILGRTVISGVRQTVLDSSSLLSLPDPMLPNFLEPQFPCQQSLTASLWPGSQWGAILCAHGTPVETLSGRQDCFPGGS